MFFSLSIAAPIGQGLFCNQLYQLTGPATDHYKSIHADHSGSSYHTNSEHQSQLREENE